MVEPAAGLDPGEHPIHHAEQQHGERLGHVRPCQLGPHLRHRTRECGHHKPLLVEDAFAVFFLQKLHVFGEHAVRILGAGVFVDDAVDEVPQPLFTRQRQGFLVFDEGGEPRDMALADADQERVFVAVVVVERGLRQIAGLRHLVHRGGGITQPGEELGGAFQNHVSLVVIGG
jgi:hypothetical protein